MKRLLIFVQSFADAAGVENSRRLIAALKPFCAQTWVLAAGPLPTDAAETLAGEADRLIAFPEQAAYFAALGAFFTGSESRKLADFDALLLVNSGCIGPLFPLAEMFERMEQDAADFWSVTDYSQADDRSGNPAFFLEVRHFAFASAAFARFWRRAVNRLDGRAALVRALRRGHRGACYIAMPDRRELPRLGLLPPFERTASAYLIRQCRLPILDRAAFGPVPGGSAFGSAAIFSALREAGGIYPLDLLTSHLRRTTPLSWQLNLPGTTLTIARETPATPPPELKFGVILHLFQPSGFPHLASYLENLPLPFDLYLTSPEAGAEKTVRNWAEKVPGVRKVEFRAVVNRGRDILPWLSAFAPETFFDYDVMLKLHLKGSERMPEPFTASWQHFLYDDLLGSPALTTAILTAFAAEPQLGLVFPPYPPMVTRQCPTAFAGHPDDAALVRQLLDACKLHPVPETGMPVFSPGTMFYYRPQAVAALLKKNWQETDFPAEPLPWRGTLAHAIERIVPYAAQASGYYFRHSVHADQLLAAFRAYESCLLYFDAGALRRLWTRLKTKLGR